MILLNWRLRLPRGHFVLFTTLGKWAQKGLTVLAEVTDQTIEGQLDYSTASMLPRDTEHLLSQSSFPVTVGSFQPD